MDLQYILPMLRQNFELELSHQEEAPSIEAGVLACYDRALATTLLSVLSGTTLPTPKPVHAGPKPGSQAAKDRAKKAAESRRRNREQAQGSESSANGAEESSRG